MVCSVCGSLAVTEYRCSDTDRCPALSCNACGAITLREEAASTSEERDSVRLAIALRTALGQSRLEGSVPSSYPAS